MAQFDLYLTQAALEARNLYDVVTQTAHDLELRNAVGAPIPDDLQRFLSLDIYFGRSRNAGHAAFFHPNYDFPRFAEVVAEAARTIRAEDYARVVDDLGTLMASDAVRKIALAKRDPMDVKSLGLADAFLALDFRSYDVRLSRDDLALLLSDYSEFSRQWVLDRYVEDQDEAYYALAAGWLLESGNLILQTAEERQAMHDALRGAMPRPAPRSKGWLGRLFGK